MAVDPLLLVQLLGRWWLVRISLLSSRKEVETSLAAPTLSPREDAGFARCRMAPFGLPFSYPLRECCQGSLTAAEVLIEAARDVHVDGRIPLLLLG